MRGIENIRNDLNWAQMEGYSESTTLEDKIAELKNDPNFSGWTDQELEEYASALLARSAGLVNALNLKAIVSSFSKPMDSEWSQYTYEEILQMEDNGVLIPDEFLEWAHSMQSSNVTEYELDTGEASDINDTEGTKSDIGEAGDMGKKNVAKVFNKKVLAQEKIMEEAAQEFEQYSSELDAITDEVNILQNATLQKVQEMINEWEVLDKKINNGEQLTDDEKSRYGQLGVMMTNEVQNSLVQIDNFTADFNELTKLMNTRSKEAKIAQDYAQETAFVGDLITEYESSHNTKMVAGNNQIFDGATGEVGLLKSNAVGKNLAVSSIESGTNLQNVTFNSDQSVKKVSAQIKNLTESINGNETELSQATENGIGIVKEQDNAETNPEENNPDLALTTPQDNKKDKENQNIFIQQEDINDIDTIIKKQQKQAPKIQPQDVIID